MTILDWIPTLDYCCCCCTVCQGSLIIGFIQFFVYFFESIAQLLYIVGVYPGEVKFNYLLIPITTGDAKNDPSHLAQPIATLIAFVFLCVFGLILIIGIYQNIPKLLLYWICVVLVIEVFNVIFFANTVVQAVLDTIPLENALIAIFYTIISILILFYCVCVVTSCYKEIVGEEDEYYY